MTIEELRAKRVAAQEAAQALHATAMDEGRDLTEDETASFDASMAEYDSLGNQVARAERLEANQTHLEQSAGRLTGPSTPTPEAAMPVVTGGAPAIESDPARGFMDMGDFTLTVHQASMPGAAADTRLGIDQAVSGMSQGTGSEGGFLVPPEFSTAIWDGMNQMPGNLLAMTDQYTVMGESITFNANAETSRATGSRYGGIRGYWIAEADQVTKSKPTFRQMRLEPQELGVFVYQTDKLIRNAGPALGQFVTRAASEEINFLVSNAILAGNGVGQPVGIIGHASTVSIEKENEQAAATIVKENIDKMWARCHSVARNRAVWIINQDTEPQLESLAMDVGTGGVPVYLPAGGIADAPNARLKGRPVLVSEYAKTLGTVGDIGLYDLSAYATGLQGGIRSDASIHLRFDYAETAFRFMFAADGQPWLASKITPFNGTNTQSPFVTLDTRS